MNTKTLKVGDSVVIYGVHGQFSIVEVTKADPSGHIKTSGLHEFNADGYEIGIQTESDRQWLRGITPEFIARDRVNKMKARLETAAQDCKWWSAEKIDAIAAALDLP